MSFEYACALADIPLDEGLAATVNGVDVVVARCGGPGDEEVFALRDLCSHAQVPLSEGEVADCQVECWLHGSRFDLRTGKPSGPPAIEPVATYAVEIRPTPDGDVVYVDVAASLTTPANGVTT